MTGQRNLGMGGTSKMMICDIKPRTEVEGQYAVCRKELRQGKKGPFITLLLSDSTGEIQARVFDEAEKIAELFEEGDVVEIAGRADMFQDKTQVVISSLSRVAPEKINLQDFLRQAARSPDEMMADIIAACKTVQQPHLRRLLAVFFADQDFAAKFKVCPGAERVHHAYVGGLAEHTLNVARLCEAVMQVHPRLDHDVLIAGALLHDIGKVQEYETGAAISQTDEGRLVGHTVIGHHLIANAIARIEGFPEELALRVEHVVLSHHGKGEWGAPRDPALPEAFALHYAENLDAKVNRALDEVEKAREQGARWTERDYFLDSRLFAGEQESGG
jgi:3'-5' exoribonuclease